MTGRIGRALLVAFLGLDGAVVAVFGVLFAPLYAGSVPAPLGVLVTLLTLPWLIRAAGELDSRPWAAGAPLIAWVAMIVVLVAVAPGGDMLFPPTWQSLLLVFVGLGAGLWSLRSVMLDEGAFGVPRTAREHEPTGS